MSVHVIARCSGRVSCVCGQAGGRLLAAAQQVGLSRPDVTPVGLFALANALSWIADCRDRLFCLVLDGLRPK
ncbi:SbtR family transcriptional regulator [Streptomyces abikoensis]|uniref:SbtR family transcriptional regulator n=1 Tax=Streptomyces abikoensis TaxID=97398 RepID=UPI0036CDF7C6